MNWQKNQRYSAPETEVLELHHEGVLCASTDINNGLTVGNGMFTYTGEEEDW